MQNSFKRKSSSLSNKLKGVLTNLPVDVLGYERKIAKNILNRTTFIANQLQINKEQLKVQIFQKGATVRSFLHKGNEPIRILSPGELALFFTDSGTAHLMNTKSMISNKIQKYLIEFSEENQLDLESVSVWISIKDDKVSIVATSYNQFFKELSLASLIKYFK